MLKLCLFIVAALALGPQAVKGQLMGADDAESGKFPYYAFLKIHTEFFCSGTLISSKHILSAGHCVNTANQYDYPAVTALLGTNNATSGGTVYQIKSQVYHPNFIFLDKIDWAYDIGIFTLENPAVLSNRIDIVTISDSENVEPDSHAIVPAAGYVKNGGPLSQVLQKLNVTIMDWSRCRYEVPRTYTIAKSQICTYGVQGKGICQGDSGAPLVQNDVVIGIVAGYVDPCGSGYPDFFINVGKYRVWINYTVRSQ